MSLGRGPKQPRFPLSLIHPLGPVFRRLPLSLRRHLFYLRHHQTWGNFRAPEKYTEKIQWRILHDRRDLIALTCDKIASKAYVHEVVVQDSRARGLRVPQVTWTSEDQRSLHEHLQQEPSPQVLKPNHSSGRYVFLDKSNQTPSAEELKHLISSWSKRDEESLVFGHWGYGEARASVFAEERIGTHSGELVEIRCATFSGEPVSYVVTSNVYTRLQTAITYDADFTRMNIGLKTEVSADEIGSLESLSDQRKSELREIVRALAAPFDHVRIDIYDDGRSFWFGEFTSYPSGGALTYAPEVELARGRLWMLPPANRDGFVVCDSSQAAALWRRLRSSPLRTGVTQASP
jgi:hypothetical protein